LQPITINQVVGVSYIPGSM